MVSYPSPSELPGDHGERSFGPTNGSTAAWLGMAVCAVFVVGVLVQDRSLDGLRVIAGAALVAWLLWLLLLRPRVLLSSERLTLRGSLGDVLIPLHRVTAVRVGAYTRVQCGTKKYSTAAVGRGGRRTTIRIGASAGPTLGEGDALQARADELLDRLERRRAQSDPAHSAADPSAVRRRWALRELAVTAALVVLVVLLLVL